MEHMSELHVGLSFFKFTTGMGVFTLPYVFATAGFMGLVMLLVVGCVLTFTATRLALCVDSSPPREDYFQIARDFWGPSLASAVFFLQNCLLIGLLTGALVLAGLSLESCLQIPWFSDIHGIIVSGVITMLISLVLTEFEGLARLQIVGVWNLVGMSCCVLYEAFESRRHWPVFFEHFWTMSLDLSTVFISLGCLVGSMACHLQIPLFVAKLENMQRGKAILFYAYIAIIAFQMYFAFIGFLAYGPNVAQSVTLSINNDIVRRVIAAGIVVDRLTTCPLFLASALSALDGCESISLPRPALVVAISTAVVGVAIATRSEFASLLGSLFSWTTPFISGVFPLCAAWKLAPDEHRHCMIKFLSMLMLAFFLIWWFGYIFTDMSARMTTTHADIMLFALHRVNE